MHEAVDEREGSIEAVTVSGGFYLFENAVVPFLVLGQIEQNPCGVDSRVELAGEEGTEYKLMQLSAGRTHCRIEARITYRDDLGNVVSLINEVL